jgi:hypothetical protein
MQTSLFRPQTGAFLKCFQVTTQTTQLDLLLECLLPPEKDNHAMYGKISKIFTFTFSCSHGLHMKAW